mmetsp:Transcript_24766/g.39224  ORF Transcript_24766/g.39224 Transcript_24766/m.39224 type:complete len:210 (+) Transcript_24766:609-1238(+)
MFRLGGLMDPRIRTRLPRQHLHRRLKKIRIHSPPVQCLPQDLEHRPPLGGLQPAVLAQNVEEPLVLGVVLDGGGLPGGGGGRVVQPRGDVLDAPPGQRQHPPGLEARVPVAQAELPLGVVPPGPQLAAHREAERVPQPGGELVGAGDLGQQLRLLLVPVEPVAQRPVQPGPPGDHILSWFCSDEAVHSSSINIINILATHFSSQKGSQV